MSSAIEMSPYCALETIGGTSDEPRAIVGNGEAVADGAAVADGVAIGVGPEVVGVTQAPTINETTIKPTATLIDGNIRVQRQISASP